MPHSVISRCDIFSSNGWSLNPDLARKLSWASVVGFDLPIASLISRFETKLSGKIAHVAYRRVDLAHSDKIEFHKSSITLGEFERIRLKLSDCPFLIISRRAGLALFVEAGSDFYILLGPTGTLEAILGCSVETEKAKFLAEVERMKPSGKSFFSNLAKLHFFSL